LEGDHALRGNLLSSSRFIVSLVFVMCKLEHSNLPNLAID
jgi:hypothetical protein